jgi:hypothetical protein
LLRLQCRESRRGVKADPAEARQLDGRTSDIDAGDEAEKVDLDAFDPAELEAGITP